MNSKNILLVCATVEEIKNLIPDYRGYQGCFGQLVSVQHNNDYFDLLITGPGMIHTSFFLGQWLAVKHYDLVINAGIAGSFKPHYPPGTVVNVIGDSFPELGAETGENFIPLGNMEMAKDYLPAFFLQNNVLENFDFPKYPAILNLPRVKGITVNTISGSEERIRWLKTHTQADIETMEGAAVFMACQFVQVPCLQIRAVSNFVEPRNLNQWETDKAVEALCNILTKLLDET